MPGQISPKDQQAHSCGCVGPQNGQPLCPCMMRGVEIVNGRYVKTIDYGPAPATSLAEINTAGRIPAPFHGWI